MRLTEQACESEAETEEAIIHYTRYMGHILYYISTPVQYAYILYTKLEII